MGVKFNAWWWHECIFEQKCYEKEFLRNGVMFSLEVIPEYLFDFLKNILWNLFFLLGGYFLLKQIFGLTLQLDSVKTQDVKNKFKHIKLFLNKAWTIPLCMAIITIYVLIFSIQELNTYNSFSHESKIISKKEMNDFFNRARKVQQNNDNLSSLIITPSEDSTQIYYFDNSLKSKTPPVFEMLTSRI